MPQVSNGGVVSLGLDLTIDPLHMISHVPKSSSEKIDLLRHFKSQSGVYDEELAGTLLPRGVLACGHRQAPRTGALRCDEGREDSGSLGQRSVANCSQL